MGDELEFRTAVGGYRKDDVLEYVESMNDKLFQMTRIMKMTLRNTRTGSVS